MTAEAPIPGRILFVDDDESVRMVMQTILKRDGHDITLAADGNAALRLFAEKPYDLVIQDLRMPGMDGLELLRKLKIANDRIQVLIITGMSTWEDAVEAMRLGAYDFIKKPFDNDEVRSLVQRALFYRRLAGEAQSVWRPEDFKLIGSTPALQAIFSLIKRVAPTDSTVVITGESGTGKELVARSLHMQSLRVQHPFISVNCGAFTETLLESELFGHIKGAFTGAVADKKGLVEVAQGGTFFLDETGEMSLQTQVRLLRMLETREFTPVGGTKPMRANVRFLAATNRDLESMVEEGTFREDLFYRLNVIPMRLPPLRERREDIPLLAGHFLAMYSKRQNKATAAFTPDALAWLVEQEWPGNIRELENTVQRAVTLCHGEVIGVNDLLQMGSLRKRPATASSADDLTFELPPEGGFDLERKLEAVERGYIESALTKTNGNLTQAAELLGMSFRSIRYKIKKLDIKA